MTQHVRTCIMSISLSCSGLCIRMCNLYYLFLGDLWPQFLELRLEIMSMKFEVTKNRQSVSELSGEMKSIVEKLTADVTLAVSQMKNCLNDVQRDILALRKRQDLVFRKQYMIHSTLAGEIHREHLSNRSGYSATHSAQVMHHLWWHGLHHIQLCRCNIYHLTSH